MTVTGEELHQEELRAFVGEQLPAPVWATLHPSTVAKGKYTGQDCIDVHIDGVKVGTLTKLMSDRYRAVVSTTTAPVCAAAIRSDARGLQIELWLPAT